MTRGQRWRRVSAVIVRDPILSMRSRLPCERYLMVSRASRHPKWLPGTSGVRGRSSLRRAEMRFRSV